MSKKSIIIGIIIITLLAAAIPVGVYLVKQQQDLRSKAQSGGGVCEPPARVTNVRVEYPNCTEGAQITCNFEQANCSWDTISGASSYSVTVTEEDSNTQVSSQNINPPTTKIEFPVTQGRTYRCDVSATNSCGATGGTGTDSLLCQVEGAIASAAPSPSASASATPTPTPIPSPTPTPTATPKILLDCAYPCNSSAECQSGLTCVPTSKGSYCALPQFATACKNNPTFNSCCQPPVAKVTPPPVLPKTAFADKTILVAVGGVVLVVLGAAFLLL